MTTTNKQQKPFINLKRQQKKKVLAIDAAANDADDDALAGLSNRQFLA